MDNLIENCLFHKNKQAFDALRKRVEMFNTGYNGDNIVQDDIFNVIKNYAKQNEVPVELLRYKIDDINMCACTFLREGRIFVCVNSAIPFGKQIFATAHELYHIWCYIEGNDPNYPERGSILKASIIDEADIHLEDAEANAFAGLFLAPEKFLREQIKIYGINASKMTLRDIYTLMDIFAIPYKAMILRLYEESIISVQQAEKFLSTPPDDIQNELRLCGIGKRWQLSTIDNIEFGSLEENLSTNYNLGFLTEERFQSDSNELANIIKDLSGK